MIRMKYGINEQMIFNVEMPVIYIFLILIIYKYNIINIFLSKCHRWSYVYFISGPPGADGQKGEKGSIGEMGYGGLKGYRVNIFRHFWEVLNQGWNVDLFYQFVFL